MLKEKRNKGLVAGILLAIVFIVIGAFAGFFMWQSTDPTSLEKGQHFYTGEDSKANSFDYLILNVYGVYEEPIATVENGGTVVWMVMHENGLVGLEASENDATIKELIAKGDALFENPAKLVVKFYDARYTETSGIQDYSSTMQGIIEPSSEVGQLFSYYTYVSYSEANWQRIWAVGAAVVLIGLGIAIFVSVLLRRNRTNRAYDEIYASYPELNGDISQLVALADFQDDVLQILVYKNHLICYYKYFSAINLTETTQIYHHITTQRHGFFVTNRFSQLVSLREGSTKKTTQIIKNIGTGTDIQLQHTFNFISEHFPNIRLGV